MEIAQTYNTAIAMYGHELMKPTIQEFLSQVAALAAISQKGPESGMPSGGEKVRLAPFDPVLNVSRQAADRPNEEPTGLIPSLDSSGNRV